ncbi:MAG TPA: YceI family protein [Thermoanaerobaculia bacterium]|jgi:polyisoprenoid-binding protein YceI|nr:YceI family protein [Thermoanaerobaculia bacterium]
MVARRRLALASLLGGLALAVLPPAAWAADYALDSERSVLLLRVWKEGAASVFAHDHVARASKLSGTVRYDPARPDAASVEVEVSAAGLVMDEPTMRRRVGLPSISDANRRVVQKTMLGPEQMDVAAYPTLSFRSQRIDGVGEGQLRVTGALTLHGQTHELTFPATVELVGTNVLHAHATLRFKQSAFGITPYSFGGAVRNRDEVELQIELVAQRPPA